MKKLCIFCGSSKGNVPEYLEEAKRLGRVMAEANIGLVYGGASWGVMGALADSILSHGGKAWGVMPEKLVAMEVAHEGLTELTIVKTMHERKQIMYDLSDGFVALPGGMGTLDEFCEIVTWAQLKYHEKPCWLYNINGFYDHLINHFKKINEEGFLSTDHLNIVRESFSVPELISTFQELTS